MELREVTVLVPTDRVLDLYQQIGEWLRPKPVYGEPPRLLRTRARYSPRTSRYDKLAELLNGKDETITLSFNEIEKAIGGDLPSSARTHRAWWANTERNTQARVWLNCGYTVQSIDYDNERVTFELS